MAQQNGMSCSWLPRVSRYGLARRDVMSPQAQYGLARRDVMAPQAQYGLEKRDVMSPQGQYGLVKCYCQESYSILQVPYGLASCNPMTPQDQFSLVKVDQGRVCPPHSFSYSRALARKMLTRCWFSGSGTARKVASLFVCSVRPFTSSKNTTGSSAPRGGEENNVTGIVL